MLNPSIIKEKYSSMTDEELVLFARLESQQLTGPIFQLLKEEFLNRNLDLRVLESAEIDRALTDLQKMTTFEMMAAHEYSEAMWQYALDEKEKGTTDYTIFNGLIDRGVEQKSAFLLIQSLEQRAKNISAGYNSDLIMGAVSIIIGLFLIYLGLSDSGSGFFFIIGLSSAIFGAIRIFKGQTMKDKYKKVLDNINAERGS